MRGIRLSKKHGVNPSLAVCWWCNKETGDIILPGRLPGDEEAPRQAVWNYEPCSACGALQCQGITLIEARANGFQNATGKWWVITEEAAKRIFAGDMLSKVLKVRKAFIDTKAANKICLTQETTVERN